MQHALPKQGEEISVRKESSGPAADLDIDIQKEVEALLQGERSPFLMLALSSSLDMFQLDDQGEGSDFSVDFSDTDGFDFDVDGEMTQEGFESLEKKIREMSIGHKIKLAYKGNKEARGILVRDANKTVAVAVEVRQAHRYRGCKLCGNRNLCDDVIRVDPQTRNLLVNIRAGSTCDQPQDACECCDEFYGHHAQKTYSFDAQQKCIKCISPAARKRYKEKYQKS